MKYSIHHFFCVLSFLLRWLWNVCACFEFSCIFLSISILNEEESKVFIYFCLQSFIELCFHTIHTYTNRSKLNFLEEFMKSFYFLLIVQQCNCSRNLVSNKLNDPFLKHLLKNIHEYKSINCRINKEKKQNRNQINIFCYMTQFLFSLC